MSVVVEHEKRKMEILDKALDVFVDAGYEDTTFQKIAERCGITRTILYLYFRNKREIFSASIKRFTEKMEDAIVVIAVDARLSAPEKLEHIASMVIEVCERESRLLGVILRYLSHLRSSGGDPDERVRRRTIRMRHILASILIEGKTAGDFPAKMPVKSAAELIYAMLEAAIFRIAVLGKSRAGALRDAISLLAASIASLASS